MTPLAALPDLTRLSHAEKDALIAALGAQVQEQGAQIAALTKRVAELEAWLGIPLERPSHKPSLMTNSSRNHNVGSKPRLRR